MVLTPVCLSSSSINLYWSRGVIYLAGKVTAGLLESNSSLALDLWLMQMFDARNGVGLCCKLCILLHYQALHTELSKWNSIKLCQTKGINGADASWMTWHCIVNVNETIKIRLLVSQGPKTFQVNNGIASGSLNWQYMLIATFYICLYTTQTGGLIDYNTVG